MIPVGLCQCGCGQKTNISTVTRRDRNLPRGQPYRFISGHNSRNNRPVQDKFIERIRQTETCWEWIGGISDQGYGTLFFDRRIRRVYAHRIAWIMFRGSIPKGLHVLHHCDNRSCVNPGHLFIGTTDDNLKDMARKGRSARGTKNGSAKLTDSNVRAIRKAYALGQANQYELASEYAVSQTTISEITRGDHWRHLL